MTHPVTVTDNCKAFYYDYLKWDRQYVCASSSIDEHSTVFKVVVGSKLGTVDKDDRKRRVIALEPTANMFLQQGLAAVMCARLRPYLDIRSLQGDHKTLAYESSITGNKATIDFSSASDSISLALIKYLVPEEWFVLIDAFRSHNTLINGELVSVSMVSSMGNAFTFPLETLVFYSLARGVEHSRLHTGNLPEMEGYTDVSVYGDDCILNIADVPNFRDVCTFLGMEFNEEKSFYSFAGGFRESCGGDFLHGKDVRPFFLNGPRDNRANSLEPWLYTICNLLIKKYISYFGELRYCYNSSVFDYIASVFREHNILVKIVPPHYPDDSGLKDPDPRLLLNCFRHNRFEKIYFNKHGNVLFKALRFESSVYKIELADGRYVTKYGYLKELRPLAEKSVIKKSECASYWLSLLRTCFVMHS